MSNELFLIFKNYINMFYFKKKFTVVLKKITDILNIIMIGQNVEEVILDVNLVNNIMSS